MEAQPRFEEIEHTADIAIRVYGRDLPELFANAAYGMACQIAEPTTIPLTVEHQVHLEAPDVETLLVSWLGELLYLGERDECVFTCFEMHTVTPTQLQAHAQGGPATEYLVHIKAVTFSELKIVPTATGYETTIVFDV